MSTMRMLKGTIGINGQGRAMLPAALAGLLAAAAWAKPLDLQMGSRGFGMGGAYAAIANDASAVYWNPGGMFQVGSLTLSETNWVLQDVSNVNVNYFAALLPVAGLGSVGGGWLMQYAGLEQGEPGTAQYTESNWFEHSFSLAGSARLWKRLGFLEEGGLGFSLNRYVLNSGSVNGAGTGFDLGFLTRFPYGLSLGLVARSLGADMMGDRIDPEYRVGLGYVWAGAGGHRITVAADAAAKEAVEYRDASEPVDINFRGLGGLEYAYVQKDWHVAVRGGANNTVFNSRDNIIFTGGVGGGFSGLRLEYAFQYNQDQDLSLGRSHRVTLEVDLGRFLEPSETKPPPAGTTESGWMPLKEEGHTPQDQEDGGPQSKRGAPNPEASDGDGGQAVHTPQDVAGKAVHVGAEKGEGFLFGAE